MICNTTHKDIKLLHDCGKRNLPIFYSPLQLMLMLSQPDKFIFIHINDIDNDNDNNGRIVGYLIGEYNFEETKYNIHVLSFAVDEKYRRKKIGTDLFNYLKHLSSNLNKIRRIMTFTLYVHVENVAAISFYTKFGFSVQSTLINYYHCDNDSLTNVKSRDAYRMIYYLD